MPRAPMEVAERALARLAPTIRAELPEGFAFVLLACPINEPEGDGTPVAAVLSSADEPSKRALLVGCARYLAVRS